MDPVVLNSAARVGGQAFGALRQPKIRLVRLGSREERREVYTRFAVAAIGDLQARVELVTHYRLLMAEDGMKRPAAMRALRTEMGAYAREAHAQRMYAQFEIELVGKESILAVAQRVDQAVSRAHQLGLEADDDDLREAVKMAESATDDFIQACRAELWYSPSWWHLHRHTARALRRLGTRCSTLVKRLTSARRGRAALQGATVAAMPETPVKHTDGSDTNS
ncbi:hypothetical protein [Streptomyces sp. NBC_00343]|uniref:hypothetical protein n=1 Tax=Streptomyces sp. NBC_00343 TaxID=2975719 RepID=UPI002E2A13AF|nr:hypothetical protein [Streptomyces sp. NBC_00343]